MTGLTFLKIIMAQRPLPVIIMSSLTQAQLRRLVRSRRCSSGAFDVLAKPHGPYSFGDLGAPAHRAYKSHRRRRKSSSERPSAAAPRGPTPAHRIRCHVPGRLPALIRAALILFIGASTGGTEGALREVLGNLPAGSPGIAIVQYIPAVFSKNFAARLNQECAFAVRGSRRWRPAHARASR